VTQVASHWLLRRNDHEHLLANLAEQLVQVLVLRSNLLSGPTVAPAQRIKGRFDLRFDQSPHADQRLAKAGELLFECQSRHVVIRTGR